MDEPKNAGTDDSEQPERPLGRGLEDLSYLFRSAQAAARDRDAAPPSRPRPSPDRDVRPTPPSQGQGTVLLRPRPPIDWAELIGLVRDFCHGIQDGLQIIDQSLPCPPCGEIDLLAVDRDGRLAVIDVATTPDDGLLVRGVSQADWLSRNHALVRRMHVGRSLNSSGSPRVFLVAPSFSPAFGHAAQRLPRVVCTRFVVVEGNETRGILFEPLAEV